MPRLACPSCRWITTSGTPSCAISTACACLSSCGANRRRTPAVAAARCSCFARGRRLPTPSRGRSVDHAQQRADRELAAELEPWIQVVPRPAIHADLATLDSLATTHDDRAAGTVQVALLERQCFVDAQPSAPQQHDQRAEPVAVGAVTNRTHHGHDLLDGRRVSGVLLAFVPGRTASVVTRHGRRRPTVASNVQQNGFHESSLQGGGDDPLLLHLAGLVPRSPTSRKSPSIPSCPRNGGPVALSHEMFVGGAKRDFISFLLRFRALRVAGCWVVTSQRDCPVGR